MPTIATTWATIAGVDLDPGELVAGAMLDDLGNNNNLLIQQYTQPLGSVMYPAGMAPLSVVGNYIDLLSFLLPASADAWPVTCHVWWEPGATDGGVRLYSSADPAKVHTITAGGGAAAAFSTLNLSASDGTDDTIILAAAGLNAKVYSAALTWRQNLSGTVANLAPLTSGARFVNTSTTGAANPETATNRPMTDELLNRMMTNPRVLYTDRPGVIFAAHEDMTASARWTVTGAPVRTLKLGGYVHVRYPCAVRWYLLPSATTTTWSATMIDGSAPADEVTISQASGTASFGGVTWYKAAATATYDVGDHVIDVALTANPGTLSIRSLVGIVEV